MSASARGPRGAGVQFAEAPAITFCGADPSSAPTSSPSCSSSSDDSCAALCLPPDTVPCLVDGAKQVRICVLVDNSPGSPGAAHTRLALLALLCHILNKLEVPFCVLRYYKSPESQLLTVKDLCTPLEEVCTCMPVDTSLPRAQPNGWVVISGLPVAAEARSRCADRAELDGSEGRAVFQEQTCQ